MHCVGFAPFVCEDSEILILGSFPSVKSREVKFYYGNPQNRFWRVLSGIFGEPTPQSVEEKKNFLKRCKIALWDMVTECDIEGSMDTDIKNPTIADLTGVVGEKIKKIFANGKTAYGLVEKYFPQFLFMTEYLPSTSPANGRFDQKKWQNALGAREEVKMKKSQEEKMHTQELYLPLDEEIIKKQTRCLERLYEYNMTRPTEQEKRQSLLKEMFAKIGENCYIEPPFRANWGGAFCHFGKNVYANFNLTLVDDTNIYVGDYTLFGPNVTVITGTHPVLPELREKGYQYNAPVSIGKNCWIGAGAIILPGVTIGDNTVIGAGSVVTKDMPSGVVAVGNPCKVMRPIGEKDRLFYYRDKKINFDEL